MTSSTTQAPPAGPKELEDRFANSLLLTGLALVILGILAVALSVVFTVGTVMLIGGLLVAGGIFEFVRAFRVHGFKNVSVTVLSGLVYLVAGAVLIARPILGALSLTLIVAAFLLVAGVVRIAHGIQHRHEGHYGWYIFNGIIDIVLAAMIGYGWPWTGLWVIGTFVGIEMFVNGITDIFAANAIRKSLTTAPAQ